MRILKLLALAFGAVAAVAFIARINVSGESSPQPSIRIAIQPNKAEVGEGQNVVISALARKSDGTPAAGLHLHAQVNGKDWGADYPTLPSGVAHLTLPLPDRGENSIVVTDGSHTSAPLVVRVHPRRFNIVDDPNHLLIMEYETWFGPGYAKWGKEEATPVLGLYSSLNARILRQHAL